jgi:EmrB/QacA subfamily drug resistance transporter
MTGTGHVAAGARSAGDPRWALVVAVLGSAMAFLDGTVVNVALPVMQRDLGITVDLVQWIVEAYALLLASLVLVGGALGDRLGRRRVFSAGAALFALASMGCGAAPHALPLIFARGLQGVGAALLVPGSLALITAAYGEQERGAAIGTWSAASAITAAIGPVAGGWVVAHGSWRWLFFFNVPVAVVVIVLASKRVPETRDETAAHRMDWIGAGLATLGLGLIVYALVGADSAGGIGSPRVLVLLAFGVLTLVAFVLAEARVRAPMVPLALFRSRTFAGTNLLTLFLYAALGGVFFFVPFDLIQVQHYTPTAAGASLLPFILLISVMSRWAGGLSTRLGARRVLVVGPLVAAAGFALLAVPGTGGSYWRTFFPGVVILGVGMGLTVAPLTTSVMASVEPHHAGVASGINNAVSRAAGLLAVAGLGVVLLVRFNHSLDAGLAPLSLPREVLDIVAAQRSKLAAAELPASIDPPVRDALRRLFDGAYVSGFRALMLTGAGLAVLAALAALWLIEPAATRTPSGESSGTPLPASDGPS